MNDDPLYLGPQSFSVYWPVLGGFILFGLLIWATFIWLNTRHRPGDLDAPLPPQAVARLRRIAMARIDEVEREVGAGEMQARRGHHELSRVVRGFVAEVSGLKVDTMTAADIRQRGPSHVADVIETYYPRQFGAAESDGQSIRSSSQRARDIVGGW